MKWLHKRGRRVGRGLSWIGNTQHSMQQYMRIFYKCGKEQKTQLKRPCGSSGCTIFNCATQRFVLTRHPTGLFPTSHFTLCIYFYLWNVSPCPPWQGLAWLHPAQGLLSQLQSEQNSRGPLIKKLSGKPMLEKPACPCPAVNNSPLQEEPHTSSLRQTQGIGLSTQTVKHQKRGIGAL